MSAMCGRYLNNADPDLIARAFGLDEFSQTARDLGGRALRPRFNIAPTQLVPVVRNRTAEGQRLAIIRRADGAAERELVTVRWGLIPSWARDPAIGNRMINARAETVAEKPAFRAAFKARRCVVPASGFYEWKRQGRGPKQPYLIQRRDGQPMGFAGLWETWADPATGEVVTTCTIVTCAPNELMAELHDRMPVILDPADYDAWLDPADPRGADPRGAELLRPCPAEWLEAVPVSTRVNSPRNDDPSVIQPEGEELRAQGTLL
jgi:putative SOS response-associated peptidase YedK